MLILSLTSLFAATLLAEALYLIFGILIGLPACMIAWRRQWWISSIAAPIAFVILMRVGGLIIALPCAVVVALLYYAFQALRDQQHRWGRILHAVIGTAVVIWTCAQAIHLPIRVFL